MSLAPNEPLLVDASVAIKWVVTEPGGALAESLLDHDLAAPDLMFAECANILWKKIRRGELTREQAAAAAQGLEAAALTVIAAKTYVTRATAIAAELDHPAYDGLYVAIAESLGLRLVTEDARLLRRLRRGPARLRRLAIGLAEVA